ncbi:hypothetical protein [Chryseobacterium turcicum]|uniref:Uncharacterized protein n=1 Tax=Chryseobacterium turcicum TaxID=2898076 RepID=A0A9Q3YYR9_9FLAO|nr:hypothetical protein [Chryseobacterium turcicum]MCD1116925.1 hypothetical protein [Chryseobacterium turcicum]
MKKLPKLGCACEKAVLTPSEYRSSEVGKDKTNGRNADVEIIQCRLCQRIWINYVIESAENSESKNWYKGIVAKKDVTQVTPENAIEYIEKQEWYIYGGSDFENPESFGQGKLNLGL